MGKPRHGNILINMATMRLERDNAHFSYLEATLGCRPGSLSFKIKGPPAQYVARFKVSTNETDVQAYNKTIKEKRKLKSLTGRQTENELEKKRKSHKN